MAIESIKYRDVLQVVETWSPEWRLALMRDLLNSLESEWKTPRPREKTLSQALGLLATDQPAPTDDQVQAMLDEHRMEKYG